MSKLKDEIIAQFMRLMDTYWDDLENDFREYSRINSREVCDGIPVIISIARDFESVSDSDE